MSDRETVDANTVGEFCPWTATIVKERWGLGSPRRRVTYSGGAIDEVRDRLRIMGGLRKIRTPGAQTGRCARRRATITIAPV